MVINAICAGVMEEIKGSLVNLWHSTGIFHGTDWRNYVMILISFLLFYLAIRHNFEPLLMLPIAFGMFIVNIPGVYEVLFGVKGYIINEVYTYMENGKEVTTVGAEVFRGTFQELTIFLNHTFDLGEHDPNLGAEIIAFLETITVTPSVSGVANFQSVGWTLNSQAPEVIRDFGLFYYIYKGVDWVIFPPIIFLGIGCMTDFGPLIANPKSMIIGAAAQIGVFLTFFCALAIPKDVIPFFGFTMKEAAAIGIIGGADGPTAIYVTKKLAEHLLPAIAISAYSYMALIPAIQKPIMRLMTTDKERKIKMKQLRSVSKLEKIVFPLSVALVVGLLLPSAMPLLGMLMLGNLLKESGVTARLSNTAQNGLMNTVTIFLGVMVGAKAIGSTFLTFQTVGIIVLGLIAFSIGTMGGLLCAKIMNKISGGKINPLIGSAGVSAVPMAARISQDVGREYDPDNHLLMHAMGPNVAGVIGSAIAAGVLLAVCGL